MNLESRIALIRTCSSETKNYWDARKELVRKLSDAYRTRFWEGHDEVFGTMVRIETADAYGYVESIIGSLFLKTPGVQVALDPASPDSGDPKLVEELINRFLSDKCKVIQEACRLALIYPNAFIKLGARASKDPLNRVAIKAVPPWEVICDQHASDWNDQRWIGHRYYLPLDEMLRRFPGKRKSDFTTTTKCSYVDDEGPRDPFRGGDLPDEFMFVEIIEFYDLVNQELLFWSPSYQAGEKLLEKSAIPVLDYDDNPLPPIIPLYFGTNPGKPLEGYSTLYRIYDQLTEKNMYRTHMANAIRRDQRVFLYKKGEITEEEASRIAHAQDGEMVALENANSLAGALSPIPTPTVSNNYLQYAKDIEADLAKGTLMAPFTRGEASGVTATEINALTTYAASETGRMAAVRDAMVEQLANCYLRSLDLQIAEGETVTIRTAAGPKIVDASLLEPKYRIVAHEGAGNPIAAAVRQRSLLTLHPYLLGAGANPKTVMQELVKAFDLPLSLLEGVGDVAPVGSGGPQEEEVDVGKITSLTEEELRTITGRR
jgi:hypothetical protein